MYVNSTNPELDLSQGMLSKQLLKRMGQKLQDKCKEYAPLAVGGVAVTPTQNLFCKYIVHVCLSSFKAKGSIKVCNTLRFCVLTKVVCVHLCIYLMCFHGNVWPHRTDCGTPTYAHPKFFFR